MFLHFNVARYQFGMLRSNKYGASFIAALMSINFHVFLKIR